jgi:7-cyano-7-deazaguanine synthase
MKLTVVPNRNMFMLAAAAAVAIARKADRLAYGAHAGDHTIYPDCRPAFVEAMRTAFGLCDWHELDLLAPYIAWTKGEICKRGTELGVPYEATWTCYVGGDHPCGQCGSCTERAEAFAFAGVVDPLIGEVKP